MKKDRHLYLTGYRGTGKSTIGRLLGRKLNRQCVDLDDRIEELAQKTIKQIFDEGGEESFRSWESDALRLVAEADPSVIALGGGAILREDNRRLIAETGLCFWLDADAETLLQRIHSDLSSATRRPALTDMSELEEIRGMLKTREPLYRQASDSHLDVSSGQPEEIAKEVLRRWLDFCGV